MFYRLIQQGVADMFCIMGINPVKKPIKYKNTFICNVCGKYGNYEVYTTYMCFSLFFIPIIKWKKHYYAYSTCCGSLYERNREIGRNLQRGV